MFLKSRFNFSVLFLLISFIFINISSENSFANSLVEKIEIKGNLRVDDETILAFISISEGSSFEKNDIDETLRKLFSTGFFEDVSVVENNGFFSITVVENAI